MPSPAASSSLRLPAGRWFRHFRWAATALVLLAALGWFVRWSWLERKTAAVPLDWAGFWSGDCTLGPKAMERPIFAGIRIVTLDGDAAYQSDGRAGVDEYVRLGNWEVGTEWTLAGWFRLESWPGDDSTWSGLAGGIRDSDWILGVLGRRPVITVGSAEAKIRLPSNVSFELKRWTHVVATGSPTGLKLFVDGRLAAEHRSPPDSPLTMPPGALMHFIGAGNVQHPFRRQVDDYAVYDRTLSPGEIAALHALGRGGSVRLREAQARWQRTGWWLCPWLVAVLAGLWLAPWCRATFVPGVPEKVRDFAVVWIVLAAGLGLTALAGWSTAAWVAASARRRFETEAQRVHEELDGYFERLVGVMHQIRDGALTQARSNPGDWDRLLDSVPLGSDFPAVTFTGIAELARREDRAAQEARWRQEYGGGFHLHPELAAEGRNFHLESLTNGVLPIIYYRQGRFNLGLPMSTNGDLGRDLAVVPAGGQAHDIQASQLAAAMDRLPRSLFPPLWTGEPADKAPPLLPIGLAIRWLDAEPNRGRQCGLLICVVDVERLFKGDFDKHPPDFGLRMVFSEPQGTVLVPLYESRQTWPETAETGSPWFRTKEEIPLYFNRLHCDFWTTPEFDRNNYRHVPWLVALASFSFTLLSAGFVAVQVRARLTQTVIAGELRVLNTQLAVATRERTRLSRDLHDGTIQSLYALGLELTHAKTLLPGNPTQAETELGHGLSALQAVVNELRQFVLELEPEMFNGQTARTALEQLVARLRRTTPLEFHLDIAPEADAMPPKAAIHVLNLVREALSNTVRHAEARNVWVELQAHAKQWRLMVRDDGRGFDPATNSGRGGRGLRGFEERSAELDGNCRISSAPGNGTRVLVQFPQAPEKIPHERDQSD